MNGDDLLKRAARIICEAADDDYLTFEVGAAMDKWVTDYQTFCLVEQQKARKGSKPENPETDAC